MERENKTEEDLNLSQLKNTFNGKDSETLNLDNLTRIMKNAHNSKTTKRQRSNLEVAQSEVDGLLTKNKDLSASMFDM